jgi:hypothetical protein
MHTTSPGNETGVSHASARAWLDLLQTSFIVHVGPPS